ncbi:MAG TPA: dTDP-4-dehydrorhamnose reductase [Rhodospirillaceae bacterium]|nr:dTDP-4-dehydrorhamnose reductase [Rhodospirillaceae bacterium]HAA92116.1 dTDP-4-dehydrorhamnose reductase [Rhodospirillaceae bacterium]HAT35167.1 dTDP-4-dehydrorhamnose reductase [Rhodospirillaceae bacterium]
MKVLLTGREGQIGSQLARLLPGFCDCWAVDQEDFDLADPEAIEAALEQFRPALIINTAAYTNVDGAEEDCERAFALNAKAPAAIAEWAAANAAALVHYSTDYVYDGSGDTPWAEGDEVGPINVYGESKLAGDEAIAATGASHLILRTSWIYAAQGQNFLNTMLKLAADRPKISVVADQVGAPTSAAMVAAVTVDILSQTRSGGIETFKQKGGIVHCVASGETSWCGFAEAIFEGARSRGAELEIDIVEPIATADYPTPAARPANSRLAMERLKQNFGIETPDWRDGLNHVLDEIYG